MRNPFSKDKVATFSVRNESERHPVPIHDIGGIGMAGVHDSKMVPIIILDLSSRPEIAELIRIHEHTLPGDLTMAWGHSDQADHVRLIMEFLRPVECLAILDFSIAKYGSAVDSIIRSKACYIQGGNPDTKISDDPAAPKVFCGIPSTGFEKRWDEMFQKAIFRKLRSGGLSRSEAKAQAKSFIKGHRLLERSISEQLREGYSEEHESKKGGHC